MATNTFLSKIYYITISVFSQFRLSLLSECFLVVPPFNGYACLILCDIGLNKCSYIGVIIVVEALMMFGKLY